MKNFLGIFVITVIGMMAFVSCEPVENRLEMKGAVTEADVRAKIKVEVIMRESEETPGKMVKSNFINIINEGLAPCVTSFTHGLGTFVGASINNLQAFVVAGEQTVLVNVLNADGTRLDPIPFTVVVEEAFDVAPEWAIFCGDGERVWTWLDEGRTWGNGGYKADLAPGWWGRPASEIDGEMEGNGEGATMTFSATGARLIKDRNDGIQEIGTFSFDMSKKIRNANNDGDWSIGHMSTSQVTVLNGQRMNDGNGPLYEYEILKLSDEELVLGWPTGDNIDAGGWSEAWFWVFRAKN